jgi:hypothetical protein
LIDLTCCHTSLQEKPADSVGSRIPEKSAARFLRRRAIALENALHVEFQVKQAFAIQEQQNELPLDLTNDSSADASNASVLETTSDIFLETATPVVQDATRTVFMREFQSLYDFAWNIRFDQPVDNIKQGMLAGS